MALARFRVHLCPCTHQSWRGCHLPVTWLPAAEGGSPGEGLLREPWSHSTAWGLIPGLGRGSSRALQGVVQQEKQCSGAHAYTGFTAGWQLLGLLSSAWAMPYKLLRANTL